MATSTRRRTAPSSRRAASASRAQRHADVVSLRSWASSTFEPIGMLGVGAGPGGLALGLAAMLIRALPSLADRLAGARSGRGRA